MSIEIVSAHAQESAWQLRGKGAFRCSSPNCFSKIRAVEKLVPIHCAGIRCPTCKRPEDLTVNVRTLNTQHGEFEFVADLECLPCKKKTGFKKVLKSIAGLLSIEVGLTGVSVKAKGKKKEE